jgi:cytochrome c
MIHLLSFDRNLLRTVFLVAFLATGASFAGAAHAGGAEAPNLEAGQALAETSCAHCHAVGRSGASPIVQAPPFRYLGRKWPVENLAEALAEGIVVGHPAMPAFAFSPAEIDDFLGWLQAIQEK